ncbi:MAG: ADYC domain-containing protein, partial [Nannocystaceae bacterium]
MRNLARALALLIPVTLFAGCDDDAAGTDPGYEPPPEEIFGPHWRGGWGYGQGTIKMNTNLLNGAEVSTVRFGYPTAYGREIVDIYVPGYGWLGDAVTTVKVVDGALQAVKGGQTIVAHAFEGSYWFIDINGVTNYMILEDVRYASEVGLSNYGAKLMTNLDPDRLVYKWTSPNSPGAGTKVDPKTGWGGSYDGLHTCAKDGNGDVWTVLSRGLLVDNVSGALAEATWAMDQYAYIACLSGAVGKTMMWGYSHDNPNGGIPNVTLPQYESALRVTRADYCGDGTSFTRPGEAVTLLDHWGINVHANDAVSDEAVFGPDGALCVDTPRWDYHAAPIHCNDGRTLPRCKTLSHCVSYPLWKC